MSRIIFWLGLVFLVIFAIRSKLRKVHKQHQEQFRPQQQQEVPPAATGGQRGYQARSAEKSLADAETMLECAHCGVFFPASEAVRAHGRDYCSSAHAALPAA